MGDLAVMHVVNEVAGGMRTAFLTLFPAQARRGDDVTLFTRRISREDLAYFSAGGVDVRPITGAVSLCDQLRQADVVHLHSADLGLILAGVLSGRPTVFSLWGLRAKVRSVTTIGPHRPPTLKGLQRVLRRWVFSLLIARAVTRVVPVSRFLAEKAGAMYGVPVSHMTVVHHGMEPLDPQDAMPRVGDTVSTVGWVGRLVPVKRVDVLLRAVAALRRGALPDIGLLVVGDGPLRGDLERAAVDLGVADAVEFSGYVDDLRARLDEMTVFVFPSKGEGLPYSVCEALYAGLPVVVLADGGGAVELVQLSGGGVVAADEAALPGVIADLMGDAARRGRLGAAGSAWARSHLGPDSWAGRFDDVYRRAITEHSSRRLIACSR